MNRATLTSLTRIADLDRQPYTVAPLARDDWQTGQYVAMRITRPSGRPDLELSNGRMAQSMADEVAIGALGVRYATLEAVGDWRAVDSGLAVDLMTSGGLIGKVTSCSRFAPPLVAGRYLGHVLRRDRPLAMADFVATLPPRPLNMPVVLIIGTSMSAGKTMSGRVIVRALRRQGLRVAGAKFTGAGRYRDILSLGDAGADPICDFVDAGLPSTVCPDAAYRRAFDLLTARLAGSGADVLVAEAGASPLEPYQGALAVAGLAPHIDLTVLAASDPYAALGVMRAFDRRPDLITGPAANTSAGIELIGRLTGVEALNLLDPDSQQRLLAILSRRFGRLPGGG